MIYIYLPHRQRTNRTFRKTTSDKSSIKTKKKTATKPREKIIGKSADKQSSTYVTIDSNKHYFFVNKVHHLIITHGRRTLYTNFSVNKLCQYSITHFDNNNADSLEFKENTLSAGGQPIYHNTTLNGSAIPSVQRQSFDQQQQVHSANTFTILNNHVNTLSAAITICPAITVRSTITVRSA